jgi:nitrogen fixation/metabolism regulation signal transduction histidine kinase
VLNAMPEAIFLVDEDVRIHELNRSAASIFGIHPETAMMKRGGEALHCLRATDLSQGCGSGPACGECVIRNSVRKCLTERSVQQRRMKFQAMEDGKVKELEMFVTVSPLPTSDEHLALMVVEDISAHTLLKSLVSICMHCKKIRDDRQYWQQVDRFFNKFIGVDFSHGLCPDCAKQHYSRELR